MFLVKFVRADDFPDEEYLYHYESEAMHHFSLFDGDDSNLYSLIEVVKIVGNQEVQLAKMILQY